MHAEIDFYRYGVTVINFGHFSFVVVKSFFHFALLKY